MQCHNFHRVCCDPRDSMHKFHPRALHLSKNFMDTVREGDSWGWLGVTARACVRLRKSAMSSGKTSASASYHKKPGS